MGVRASQIDQIVVSSPMFHSPLILPNTLQVPCVGVSIGIERIFAILEAKAEVSAYPVLSYSLDITKNVAFLEVPMTPKLKSKTKYTCQIRSRTLPKISFKSVK